MSIPAVRLNHAVLYVSDLQRAVRFYTEAFGMHVAAAEPRANAAFLRLPLSGNHHDLGLFGLGPQAAQRPAASGSTTWRGRSTPSTSWPRPVRPSSFLMP